MKEKMDLKKAACKMGMEEYSRNIHTKQFQILTDTNLIWDFMVEIYGRNFTNGVAAPFYEYAITSTWMDISYQYLNRIWFDGDKIVAFVFTESPVTNIFFNLRPGYEDLVEELLNYAEEYMPNFDNQRQFILFQGQDRLMDAVAKRGYSKVYEEHDFIFDFQNELAYQLPEGFHFVKEGEVDPIKLARCCWKGFNHEQDIGPFEKWDEADSKTSWNPQKAYNGVKKAMMCPAPHATPQYDVVIANENEEYVCFSGMWWVKENNLAYMEPLCTIPEYRNQGLAAVALSKHYERMKKLGATHMTGGGNEFYKKIGYTEGIVWTHWKKI